MGTTHEKHTLEYPRRVSKRKDFNTTDKQARTWKKRITVLSNQGKGGRQKRDCNPGQGSQISKESGGSISGTAVGTQGRREGRDI